MTAARRQPLISVKDYLAGELISPIKHEYCGGYVYATAGARNVHNEITGAFYGAMYAQLRGRPCRPFNSDTKVRVQLATHTRFYYPDGMVVCEPNDPAESFQDRPIVIAEVTSKATQRIDEIEKRDAYLAIPTLSTYLIIDSDSPRGIVHQRTDSGFVAETYEGMQAIIPLPAINAEIALAELYERVKFVPKRMSILHDRLRQSEQFCMGVW